VDTVHGRFRSTAERHPDSVAVRCDDLRLTYAELDELSDRLASRLERSGVEPGSLVAIRLHRGLAIPVAILGVLKRGCAYVPIDPDYPADRQQYMVDDARARHLVQADDPDDVEPEVVEIPGAQVRDPWPLPAGVAYVIYTSGSTGRPKGVVVGHQHVLAMADAVGPFLGLRPDDAIPLFHSFCFDATVWELWAALLFGGTLVVVRRADAQDPSAFAQLLADAGVTMVLQIPTIFGYLVRALEESPRSFPDLRCVLLGGEAVDLAAVQRWRDLGCAPGARVINAYGPTETTVFSTFRELSEADRPGGGRTPIGRPAAHLRGRLVGEDLEPVADGEPGELLVAGTSVAFGYLGRPELTAERFVPLPDDPGPWYRTGDWVVQATDGDLTYAGRRDGQVKVRGLRIELGEIEAVVREHPEVVVCAVTVDKNRLGENSLTVHYVPCRADADLAPALRAHAQTKLPKALVPVRYRRHERLPLTGSGKIDRSALSAPPDTNRS
jgi:amino acid adenylation domain-containing protein